MAQQIVLGDLPVRDFIDPGEFLFNYTSAAMQLVFGRTLGSEVLLDALFLALGHTLVFVLAWTASRSWAVALTTTAVSVLLVTRLYSYPKLFLYPAAVLLAWRYVDRPTPGRLYAGAVCTAIAFLFRHDHGANVGAAMGATLLVVHWRDWRLLAARVARFASVALALLVPFLIFVQVTGGVAYWRNTIETGRAEYQRTVGPYPQFSVEEGVGGPDNALAWLYYLTIALPPLTLLMVALRGPEGPPLRSPEGPPLRGGAPSRRDVMPNDAPKMIVAAVLAIAMHVFLLRAASESAVADVSALTAILGAWLLARGFRRPVLRAAVAAALLAVTIGFTAFTEGVENARSVLAELSDGEPGPLFRRFGEYWRMAPPFEDEGARYVFACTAETDRLLVASAYAPHAYYAAGRGFAAGRQYFLSSQGPSAEFRAFSARRLEQERVPIVLVHPPDYQAFARGFDAIHAYLQAHYRQAGVVEFDESPLTVLTDRRITPQGTWGERELPCFRPSRPPN